MPNQHGAPMKYPQIATIEPGQEIFVNFPRLIDGSNDPHEMRNMARTFKTWAVRKGWKFLIRGHVRGLYVYRVPNTTDQLI